MVKVNDRVRLRPDLAALEVPMAGTVAREADEGARDVDVPGGADDFSDATVRAVGG